MARNGPRTRVGCSGWEYKHWKGDFYPEGLPRQRWFQHYAGAFDTVEINNSFYRLPQKQTMKSWRLQAPAGFVYAVKASRYLTHMRKLKDPADPLALLFDRARELGPHLGPVLYQLPPRWKPDHERLEAFLRAIPRDVRQAIEFREPAWYTDRTFELLSRSGVALCLHDMAGSATPRVVVGPFVYVRFHGASAKYAGSYSPAQLDDWAEWLDAQMGHGLDVYAYFNNDVGGHAPRNAAALARHLVGPHLESRRPSEPDGPVQRLKFG
ncbi:MAG TPA: DUF72 domain-containing protein [Vicinamibacterales bacterium]|nr:DUF72 domain-containing protein [Vicinamibacterales bacterium]